MRQPIGDLLPESEKQESGIRRNETKTCLSDYTCTTATNTDTQQDAALCKAGSSCQAWAFMAMLDDERDLQLVSGGGAEECWIPPCLGIIPIAYLYRDILSPISYWFAPKIRNLWIFHSAFHLFKFCWQTRSCQDFRAKTGEPRNKIGAYLSFLEAGSAAMLTTYYAAPAP